ncbi:MAG TPA: hypothetical protein VFQ22_14325, partial [Longimicrobiales bacterium]|nr:hypothetical protein [Longimicrobiales bacterium]
IADVVVAEAYVILDADPSGSSVRVLLHGAAAGGMSDTRAFDDAQVTITRSDGLVLDLVRRDTIEVCVRTRPSEATGTCFTARAADVARLEPSDRLDLEIRLGDGGRLDGSLTVPGPFALEPGLEPACVLPPDVPLPVRWRGSEGAWAYVNETMIEGLRDALAPEGIEVEEDPLYLLGLSISSSDTTIVFPGEFGVFERFDLDQDLALRLQRGLPDGASAQVSIAAVERNYVNWARGGSFNPSGQVRVPSVRGDGSGVFGAALVRRFGVTVSGAPGAGPVCPLP